MVKFSDRTCPSCGIDLALAASLAVQAMSAAMQENRSTPLAPEVLVPRLGERLVEKGLIREEDLQNALEQHRRLQAAGGNRLFGQFLLDLNLIQREDLDLVVTEQILHLQRALQGYNRQLEERVHDRTADLHRALNRLSELNDLKNNFISNISHELRTPLTHLKGYLMLLADETLGSLNEHQAEAMQAILRAESRLEQLIEDLIQFALTSRGELTLNKQPVSLSDLLRGAVSKASERAAARQINLQVQLPKKSTHIKVDIEKISWVLLQLQDNAIKFTPPGGRVYVEAHNEDSTVTLFVRDNGIGIPENRLEEIFEPFHQLDGSTTRQFGGTGMGLALVRRIVEAHGSSIRVRSKPGKGSEFSFTLPVFSIDHVG
jgi:signal transduction histidine kinase